MSYVDSVQRAIDYIEEHLDEELTLSRIAEEAYISVAQLYRLFYAITGHPVKNYIRKRRISVAANYLRNSNQTVEELAWVSGYESYQSFAKVFKKIVGITPATYRKADIFFSFEPIRLHEHISYMEDKEQMELYPDVKVFRFMPCTMYSYEHISKQEAGLENEALRVVSEKLEAQDIISNSQKELRMFGYNVEVLSENGEPRYGYRILIMADEEQIFDDNFSVEPFVGGLYAVRKIAADSSEIVQDGWNRLLSEWLPKSTFEMGRHKYIEEFITYNKKLIRMHLYLPVQRKLHIESIKVVVLTKMRVIFWRGYGSEAQSNAENQLIDWYQRGSAENRRESIGKYYMSFDYGNNELNEYWWENGILTSEAEALELVGLKEKHIGCGTYACCISKTYGLLTGVLDQMHRWIAINDNYRLDEERQWFAEYHTFAGMNVERDSIVKVYIPIIERE